MSSNEVINELFNHLDDWRLLPGYQLERRADIFFGVHLKLVWQRIYNEEVMDIIPEFPIRKGLLPLHNDFNPENPKKPGVCKGPNGSFQIDYLIITSKRFYLVELKTDMASRNDKQDWYLNEAVKLGIDKLCDGVEEISNATAKKHKHKYRFLIDKLKHQSLLQKESDVSSKANSNQPIKVCYIQPTKEGKDTISFDDLENAISHLHNAMTLRFRASLQKWKTEA